MKRQESIFMIGFSGAGKSSVGRSLARNLRVRFYDIDEMVAEKAKMSIREIFSSRGQAFFRRLEQQIIKEVVRRSAGGGVVALGGGAFQDIGSRRLVLAAGTVVYLSCSQAELYRRLRHMSDRPLLLEDKEKAPVPSRMLKDRIKLMLGKRIACYRLAHIRQSTTGMTVKDTVNGLIVKLDRYYAEN